MVLLIYVSDTSGVISRHVYQGLFRLTANH